MPSTSLSIVTARPSSRTVSDSSAAARSLAPREKPREWDARERLQHEKEVLGFYLTGHPRRGVGHGPRQHITPRVTCEEEHE